MKKIVVSLVFCWCLCEVQVAENDGKVDSCLGQLSCCCSLNLLQNFGSVGEKLTNMAEKISVLENKLQNTEKTVLELQSIIGSKSKCSICRKYLISYTYVFSIFL